VVYVGIDLHRRTSHVAAFDEEGLELLSRRVRNDPEALRDIFAELGGEARVALEAAFGWEWLADLLEAEGIELYLAHPRHTKAIAAARVKTDAVDARTLAHLLRADLLPEAYVAPPEVRELRSFFVTTSGSPAFAPGSRTASMLSLPDKESSTGAPSSSAQGRGRPLRPA
jgi:transposase